ncbi:MAG: CoA ester lyase [Pseudomonadota bacterium]
MLFVSADDPARLQKAHLRGADALVLDLEDAVPPDRKQAARDAIGAEIDRLAALGQALVVRVNTGWLAIGADLAACIRPGVRAIMLPKVEEPWHVRVIAEMIGELELQHGVAAGSTGIVCLIESAAGLEIMGGLAAIPRVVGLALGSEDFALSMGVPPSPELLDLPCRQLALAASRAGIMAIAVPASIAQFRDMDAYAEAIRQGMAYGVTAALCIHPNQITVANRELAPSLAEMEQARAVMAAWRAHGGAGVLQLGGKMIDRPVMLRAAAMLARAAETAG